MIDAYHKYPPVDGCRKLYINTYTDKNSLCTIIQLKFDEIGARIYIYIYRGTVYVDMMCGYGIC